MCTERWSGGAQSHPLNSHRRAVPWADANVIPYITLDSVNMKLSMMLNPKNLTVAAIGHFGAALLSDDELSAALTEALSGDAQSVMKPHHGDPSLTAEPIDVVAVGEQRLVELWGGDSDAVAAARAAASMWPCVRRT